MYSYVAAKSMWQCEKSKRLEEYLTRKGHLMQARDKNEKLQKTTR